MSARAATTTAIGELAGLVIGTCALLVVSLLAVAAVALVFMFFAAYMTAYALVIAFSARSSKVRSNADNDPSGGDENDFEPRERHGPR